MDLLGGLDMGPSTASVSAVPAPAGVAKQNTVDLLGDLFGSNPVSNPVSAPVMGGPSVVPMSAPVAQRQSTIPSLATPAFPSIRLYAKNGLAIDLNPVKNSPTLTRINTTFSSVDGSNITNIVFQIALPKVSFLELY